MEIKRTELISETEWVLLKEKIYTDRKGRERRWEYLERRNCREAVFVLAVDSRLKKILLIRQFRLPFADYVLEFPAGLIDPGESIESTAARELLEETGYTGRLLSVSPRLCLSAGLTTETAYLARMDVELSDGPQERQALEAAEDIEAVILETENLKDQLLELSEEMIIDSKLWSWAENPG